MKTRILFLLICSLLSMSAVGQGTVSRQKCSTCGKVLVQCPYKGKHPKTKPAPSTSKKTKPVVKHCNICGKPLSQCDYGGKHPYCQTCGKLKERCEYKGVHPVCQICGKLKEECKYKGKHPVCQICGKLKEECEYKGKHPVCQICGKLKEECEYKGEHPVCQICGKLKEECEYKGEHPVCQICGKLKEECEYKGEHPVCQICGKLKEECEYKGKHPVCQICGKLKEECEYKGEHPVCQICRKLKEECEYKGEHPVCQICGKLKEECEYKGEHPTEILFSVGNVSFSITLVEGGTFTMGATPEQKNTYSDENPTHNVTLSSYYIGKYEVTQALWKAVMGSNPSYFKGDKLPVEQVSWDDCQNFLRKLNAMTGQNFRLPTEAEWEYAARGGNRSRGYQYSGSDNLNDVAWCEDNSGNQTHNIGTKSPNELGIYDMSGNVWEWCQDWFGDYSSNAQTNPKGPDYGPGRVNRGGGWSISARYCRIAFRSNNTPGYLNKYPGLRIALSL